MFFKGTLCFHNALATCAKNRYNTVCLSNSRPEDIMRIWIRLFKDNRLLDDTVIEDKSESSRTKKVTSSLERACHDMNLAVPVWLSSNITEFQRYSRTRFLRDNFNEDVIFDYMDFMVIEE